MAIDISFSKLVTYGLSLIVLIVLVAGVGYVFTPAGKVFNSYLSKVIESLGNAPQPFTGKAQETATATASLNALVYSINKVAWHDSYKNKKKPNFDAISKMSKDFLGATAYPVLEKGELIDDIPNDKGLVLQQITISAIDCWKIFLDKERQNTACFNLVLPEFSGKITYHELDNYGKAYDKNSACNEECKKISDDVFGSFLNAKNYRVSMKEGEISGGDNIIICAGNRGKDEVFITDSEKLAFDECKSVSGTNYGMRVKNFQLPQTLGKYQTGESIGGNIVEFAELWAHAYGDPEYIAYYEKFPKGEDAYWEESAYAVNVVEILGTEALMYVLFDRVLPGLGSKIIKPAVETSGLKPAFKTAAKELGEELAEETGETSLTNVFKKITNLGEVIGNAIKNAPAAAFDFFDNGIYRILSKISKAWVEHIDEQAAKKAGRIIIENLELDEEAARIAKEVFDETYDDAARGALELLGEGGELSDEFLHNYETNLFERLNKEGVVGDRAWRIASEVADNMDTHLLRLSDRGFKKIWRLAININDKVLEQFKVWKDIRFSAGDIAKIKEGIKEAADSASFFNDLSPAYIRRFSSFSDEALDVVLEQQGTREFAEEVLETAGKSGKEAVDEILGKYASNAGKSMEDLTSEEIRAALDPYLEDAFNNILKDTNPLAYSSGKLQTRLREFATSPRRIVSAYVAFGLLKDENLREKFRVIGTNAIGFRTPYLATTLYDDFYTSHFDYEKNPQEYENFFRHYFGYSDKNIDEKYLRYRGLLPEVNKYYLSLNTKDSYSKRLHLVSPCYADLVVEKTICECWGSEKEDTRNTIGLPIISNLFEHDAIYQTGKSYVRDGLPLKVSHFDGENAMLYTISENRQVVKECYPKGEGISNWDEYLAFWKEATYKPSCIQVSVVMDPEKSPNYCYRGETSTKMKIANVGLNWVLPIGLTLTPAGPVGGAVGGAVGGLVYAWMQANSQWPSHN